MRISLATFLLTLIVRESSAFIVPNPTFRTHSVQRYLFEDDEEMIPVAENYLRAKYQASATDGDITKAEAVEILRAVLPPVTAEELETEVESTLSSIMENPDDAAETINESKFVEALLGNSYWEDAGDLVVKELMYFDALHCYYQTGESLLNDEDYGELKDNLTWEGSSVPMMKGKEAKFVTAVASSRRGMGTMGDEEYGQLKSELKKEGSWVTDREPDALEKMGISTFMGYLHRSLSN
mmetsp:Transcript_18782/g.26990  ORF Transcript_18782/g.26990 Transcript_18782/m.26990 type:complete len:239 (-) Transcript_18782:55-771(-)|eukprot:CAMPEP_0202479226 /NCGR_PEP_ID=MMETSP1360-20130828/94872_1 /ASSEMBLY_ACC=CAM_ASM_000848 /TAXON_ID=515479 /ORGANISM="Licmophora paradoxa, Strain CCMP2313" /LENGTH=238 /DNA_ID=CAMNT_0049106539 /DNA_START=151 /DNA_END=867 /DNA_ORIENTATION=-